MHISRIAPRHIIMPQSQITNPQSAIIIGGGLAGLAAAVGLAQHGFQVKVLESRNRLGGRASSFTDPATGQMVDACQHVSMGCCTNLTHFLRTVGVEHFLAPQPKLYFVTPDRRKSVFKADPRPTPLHLGRLLTGAHFTSLPPINFASRTASLRCFAKTGRRPASADMVGSTWQNRRTIERFWGNRANERLERNGRPRRLEVRAEGVS